jgi:DNA-binding HxlR family transcriptional regulator
MVKDLTEKADVIEVLRGLSDGKEKRFSELLLLGIPRANLARRLKELESGGFIARRVEPSRPPQTFYKITDKGMELYKSLLKEKAVIVEEFIKHYPQEAKEILRRYLKLEDKK